MPEWKRCSIGSLLDAWWPGEWGVEPDSTSATAVVYRSTDLDDDGHLVEDAGALRSLPPAKILSKRLRKGDVLLEASGGAPERPVGRTALFKGERSEPALAANFIRTLRPNDRVSGEYLNWALLHLHRQPAIWRYQQQTTGMSNLKVGDYLRHELAVPSRDVQGKIAAVLQCVDDAIEQTEALLSKMQQVKAGMMHDLFTRGVTPDGRLRPTRAEAAQMYKQHRFGYGPADWDSAPLGSMSQIVSGVTLDAKRQTGGTIEVPYLRVANVQDGFLDLGEVKRVAVSPAEVEQLRLQAGDVLMNEGGDFDKLGRGCVWGAQIDPCIHQNHVFRVRCDARLLVPRYLAYWSQSTYGKQYFVRSSKQSTNLASINSTQLKAFPIGLPPLVEQNQIVIRLAAVDTQLDSLRLQARKLHSVKSGLMPDLLTGRVRVKPSPGA